MRLIAVLIIFHFFVCNTRITLTSQVKKDGFYTSVSKTEDEQIQFFLYNGSTISRMIINRNGFEIIPLDIRINTDKGVAFDPSQNMLLWNEEDVIHVQKLNSLKAFQEKIWIPERIGHMFHYDWRKKEIFWYSGDNKPNRNLRTTNLNTRYSAEIKLLESGALEGMDSFKQILFYEHEDSIKMLTLNGMEEIGNFTFDGDFKLMDVVPESEYIVVCESPGQSGSEDEIYTYRFLNYSGFELHSFEISVKFDQIFMEKEYIVYKHNDEIGIISKVAGDTLFSVNNQRFSKMVLKRLHEVPGVEDIKPLSSVSGMECTDDDTNEICFRDEKGLEVEDLCLYQGFIISNGTCFEYYNPSSGALPFSLPFALKGKIRAFTTYLKQRIFWIDDETNLIMGTHLYSHKEPDIIGGELSQYPSDIKVDENRKNVFWTDRERGTIEVVDFEGKYYRVLFQSLNMPSKLILALDYGLIVWAEGPLNNTVKAGWIAENAQKVLLECKVPIFGFVLDYIYNILYVGSQNEYLYIQAVNLNLGYRREIYKSKFRASFTYMSFSRGNFLYLMERTQLWKFNVWDRSLEPVSGLGFNASLISPLRCPVVRDVDAHCLNCPDFCFPSTSTSFFSNVAWQCYHAEYISLRESKCIDTSSGFLLVATYDAVYFLNDRFFTKVYDLNSTDTVDYHPIAFDKDENRLFVASKSDAATSIILSDPCEGPGEADLRRHSMTGGLLFCDGYLISSYKTSYISYLDPYNMKQKITTKRIDSSHSGNLAFSLNTASVVYYNIMRNDIYIFSINIETGDITKITETYSNYNDDIIMTFSENKIYYWKYDGLYIVELDVERRYTSKRILEEKSETKMFAVLNRKIYFVSKKDNKLYRLDYLSENKTITPILNAPKNIRYILSVEK